MTLPRTTHLFFQAKCNWFIGKKATAQCTLLLYITKMENEPLHQSFFFFLKLLHKLWHDKNVEFVIQHEICTGIKEKMAWIQKVLDGSIRTLKTCLIYVTMKMISS